MKSKFILIALMLVAFVLIIVSCNCKGSCKQDNKDGCTEETKEKKDVVLTQEAQQNLTPDKIIEQFKAGNENFVNDDLTERDHLERISKTSSGQYPKAIVLACVDSRVPVEKLFDKGIGDVFVARVAGNFVNEDILGSMEYACKVAGSKVIVVLGHEYCGAIKAAVKGVKMGNITGMLSKITPAIENLQYDGEKSYKNKDYMHKVCESNVKNTIKDIRLGSPILKEMEDKGEIKIVGGIYDLDDGKVHFLE